MGIVGLCVNGHEEVAMDATGGLKRQPGEGRGRIDDASTAWGDDTNRPAFATTETPSPRGTPDMPAPLEATRTSLGGESAPAEQDSRHRIQRGPVTRVAESALPLFQTCFRSVLTWYPTDLLQAAALEADMPTQRRRKPPADVTLLLCV